MPLDINIFRADKGADPEVVRISQRRRYHEVEVVDRVIDFDTKWRKATNTAINCRRVKNVISKAIGARMKELKGQPPADNNDPLPSTIVAKMEAIDSDDLTNLNVGQLRQLVKVVDAAIAESEAAETRFDAARTATVGGIGNLVHESVPVSDDEDNNAVLRTWGQHFTAEEKKWNHVDVMTRIGCMDTTERATSVSGGRAYFLTGDLVMLQIALIQYAMTFLVNKQYKPLYPPFFMLHKSMADVSQLSQFDEELYHVTETHRASGAEASAASTAEAAAKAEATTIDTKYLIATSEQPICAYHRNQRFGEKDLATPIRYAGWSTCFRKEAGSHGRDTSGIFRVHQFDKVEQFVVCSPTDSWAELDSMIANAEAFYQSLGIAYRVVDIVSGALNLAAARKFDLEAWFPAQGKYRELVSCSNCTDYQARAVGCRYGLANEQELAAGGFVHMLNGTMCAVTRALCVIMETYQCEEGVRIPELRVFTQQPLRPHFMGRDLIPWDAAACAAHDKELAREAAAKAAKEAKDAAKAAKAKK